MKNFFKKIIKTGGRQTPVEKLLITTIAQELINKPKSLIINIGAGKSTLIEDSLEAAGCNFIVDRLDVTNSSIDKPYFKESFNCSIEDCKIIPSFSYNLAFANYVFEHLRNLPAAARETARILKPGGALIITIPNPQAPEFQIAKRTPLSFHQAIRGKKIDHTDEAFETFYAYQDPLELINIFIAAGFALEKKHYRSFVYGYLYRFPIISQLAKLYDLLVNIFKLKILSGQVCLVFRKNK